MSLLRVLQSKNRCLQRFLDYSVEFLCEAERGDLTRLDIFHRRRETILKALALYDGKVAEMVRDLSAVEKTSEMIEAVKVTIDEKTRLVLQILETDEKIVVLIKAEQKKVRQELGQSQKQKEVLGKFKSQRENPGEELDKTL